MPIDDHTDGIPRPDPDDLGLHHHLGTDECHRWSCRRRASRMWQWTDGRIAVGAVATAIPLAWQLTNIAGWVARSVTAIFENIGTVQDGMRSIDVPRQMPDPPGAVELHVTGGEIRIEDLHFDYGRIRDRCRCAPGCQASGRCLHGIDLTIAPGRACRSDRAVRRGQIDAGQPAAAFLRPRKRAAS